MFNTTKKISNFIFHIYTLLFSACINSRFNDMNKAEKNGLKEIVYAAQINELFPDATHFISYYTGEYGTPTWNSTMDLYGRYVFTMQCEVEFDADRLHIISHEPPIFYIHEMWEQEDENRFYGSVEVDSLGKSGMVEMDSLGKVVRVMLNREFGADIWKKIFESKGDFTQAGMDLIKNKPVTVRQRN